MSWKSGASILVDAWTEARVYVPEQRRVVVLAQLMKGFSHNDCDTLYELEDCWPEAHEALVLAGEIDEEDS